MVVEVKRTNSQRGFSRKGGDVFSKAKDAFEEKENKMQRRVRKKLTNVRRGLKKVKVVPAVGVYFKGKVPNLEGKEKDVHMPMSNDPEKWFEEHPKFMESVVKGNGEVHLTLYEGMGGQYPAERLTRKDFTDKNRLNKKVKDKMNPKSPWEVKLFEKKSSN